MNTYVSEYMFGATRHRQRYREFMGGGGEGSCVWRVEGFYFIRDRQNLIRSVKYYNV